GSLGSRFFCQAEDGIRDRNVTGVQTCALPILPGKGCVPLERAGACTPKRPRSNAGLFLCPGRQEKRPAVKSRPPEEAGGAPKDEIGRARVGKECGGRGAAEEHKGKRGAGGDTQ